MICNNNAMEANCYRDRVIDYGKLQWDVWLT